MRIPLVLKSQQPDASLHCQKVIARTSRHHKISGTHLPSPQLSWRQERRFGVVLVLPSSPAEQGDWVDSKLDYI